MNIIRQCLSWSFIHCALLLSSDLLAADEWAALKGRFVYDGAPPAAKFLNTSGKDSETCAKHKIPDKSLLVDSVSKGIANVLVFARKTSRVHDSHQQAVKEDVVFDQKECVFLAHVLPVHSWPDSPDQEQRSNWTQHQYHDTSGHEHQPTAAAGRRNEAQVQPTAEHSHSGRLQHPSLDEGLYSAAQRLLRCRLPA